MNKDFGPIQSQSAGMFIEAYNMSTIKSGAWCRTSDQTDLGPCRVVCVQGTPLIGSTAKRGTCHTCGNVFKALSLKKIKFGIQLSGRAYT